MAKPTTRVLAVLDLLQTHGRMSGPELARRIGVDVRTLRRYIVMLEDLGIPLTTERGRYGSYMLVAGYRLPPMMFTNDEAVALSVGMVAARGLGLAEAAPAVESAQAKLARVMPGNLQRHVRAIADTVRIDLASATHAPDSNTALVTLTSAAQAQQRVHLQYTTTDGHYTERLFDPYGLAFWSGSWYVLGMCHLRQALRSFRLDRMREVVLLDDHFERPTGFDALATLMHSVGRIPRKHTVEVLLRTDLPTARQVFSSTFGVLEPIDSGTLLRSSADDLDWFARRLAGLTFDFDIRRPDRLHEALMRHAQHLQRLASSN